MADPKDITAKQRAYFESGETRDVSFRVNALRALRIAIRKNEKEILDALKCDLNKSPFEAYETEVGVVLEELNYIIKNLPKWARNKKVRVPKAHFKSACYIVPEPYGVILIMSPWNYPFHLTLVPLLGAIAGGNCAVVKPSAYSPCTLKVMARILGECFAERYIAVIEGGREANQELLQQKFDYIFFTGSVSVGKTVMEAAAKNLTPLTLELGGKSPCIVDRDANIEIAARRIVWGKFLNSGQTCVAPDYVMVHKDVKSQLLSSMRKYIKEFYGDKPCDNGELPRIINEKHFQRIKGYLSDGRLAAGGDSDEESLRIAPALLDGVTWEDSVMREEIFGPVLPVLEFDDITQVISAVNSHPRPLALYLFTTSKKTEKRIVESIPFGGGCINDTLVHLLSSHMPFGGVGESGMGSYHGKWSFDTFTHQKSILKKSNLIDIKLRYPPYKNKIGLLKKLLG